MNLEQISGEEVIGKFEMNLLLGVMKLEINFDNNDMHNLLFYGISNILYIRNNMSSTKRKREESDRIYGELWDLSTENTKEIFIQNKLFFCSNVAFNIYNELFLLECSQILWDQEILYSDNTSSIKKTNNLLNVYGSSTEKIYLKFISINKIEYYDDIIKFYIKNIENQEIILSFSKLNAYLFLSHPKITCNSSIQVFKIHDKVLVNTNSAFNNDYYNNYTNDVKFNYYIMIDGKLIMYLDAKFDE